MREGALIALAFVVAYLSFAQLALAQRDHWMAVSGRARGDAGPSPAAARRRRRAGAIGLVLSASACWLARGASFGSLLAVFCLASSAWAVALTLTWRGRWLRALV
ncbi:MAG: DUF3325 family protein [Polyangiaceae bacterium]